MFRFALPFFHLNESSFFSPSAVEAVKLLDTASSSPGMTSSLGDGDGDDADANVGDATRKSLSSNFSTDAGTQRLLVWLLAPVAAESAQHAQLLVNEDLE